MKFADFIKDQLAAKNLLNHEFYQAWSSGTIPKETLRLYARQYYHHVRAFPRYLSATHSNCDDIEARQFLLENLIDEEKGPENHPELWLRFAEGLGESRSGVENSPLLPETKELVETFLNCSRESYSSGLGALFAYEHQIPAIAKFKIEALQQHYGIREDSTLSFFEVHRKADVYHTETITQLLDELSETDKEQALKTARIAADQLWKFLDGIHRS